MLTVRPRRCRCRCHTGAAWTVTGSGATLERCPRSTISPGAWGPLPVRHWQHADGHGPADVRQRIRCALLPRTGARKGAAHEPVEEVLALVDE
jgi:hypothetical protein